MNKTQHYVQGKWTSATGEGKPSYDAVTGEFIAETSVEGLDIPAILHYGRTKGGEKSDAEGKKGKKPKGEN